EAFFAGVGVDGKSNVEIQCRAAGAIENRRERAWSFACRTRNERDRLAVEAGFTGEKSRGGGGAGPGAFLNVDGEGGVAGSKIAGDTQVVVDAGERGVYGRRLGVVFGRKSLRAERAVLVDRQNDPSRRFRSVFLLGAQGSSGCKRKEQRQHGEQDA